MYKRYSDTARKVSYYISNTDIPRPFVSALADSFLLIFIFFSVLYIWTVYRTKSPILSLLICLVATSLFGYAIYLRKRSLYAKKREEKHRLLARDYMIDSLALLSRQEFEWQILRALSVIEGISNIEQRQGYLKAQYHDMPLAIGYHQAPPKGYETYERVWGFYTNLRAKGYNNLLYISSGYFEDTCNNIYHYSPEISITLLDMDGLLNLMEEAGMGPDDDLIEVMAVQKIADERRKRKEDRKLIPSSQKLRKYMISSLLFFGASLVFRAYFLFYIVLGLLFFVLGLLSLILPLESKGNSTETLR